MAPPLGFLRHVVQSALQFLCHCGKIVECSSDRPQISSRTSCRRARASKRRRFRPAVAKARRPWFASLRSSAQLVRRHGSMTGPACNTLTSASCKFYGSTDSARAGVVADDCIPKCGIDINGDLLLLNSPPSPWAAPCVESYKSTRSLSLWLCYRGGSCRA